MDSSSPRLSAIETCRGKTLLLDDRGAIDLQIKYLGEKHRNVVESLIMLAGVYEQAGQKDPAQYPHAQENYERAISLQESMVGTQHPQLLPLLRRYAQMLRTMKDAAQAAEVEKKIAAITAAAPNQR
jgi:hypothetical protein